MTVDACVETWGRKKNVREGEREKKKNQISESQNIYGAKRKSCLAIKGASSALMSLSFKVSSCFFLRRGDPLLHRLPFPEPDAALSLQKSRTRLEKKLRGRVLPLLLRLGSALARPAEGGLAKRLELAVRARY